jgi:hypothetical protein
MKKDLFYSLTCLAFAIIIGGAFYEHLNVVPKWAAAPPLSLSMFQGQYGLKPELFWMLIHPVTLLLFAITLVMHWRSARRKPLLIVLGSYLFILVVTSIYFVPELISITTTAFSTDVDAELTRRAARWESLSLVRLGLLVIFSLVLFMGLTKANQNVKRQNAGVRRKEMALGGEA